MSKECETCGMKEDHYGKNTMPIHRLPIDRHTSILVCDDCAKQGLDSGPLPQYQMDAIDKIRLKERRGKL
jgi:hypothetical protein